MFAAGDEGLSVKQIASVLEITEYQATDIVESLKEEYISDVRGIQVIEIAGVYQMTTKKEALGLLEKAGGNIKHSRIVPGGFGNTRNHCL